MIIARTRVLSCYAFMARSTTTLNSDILAKNLNLLGGSSCLPAGSAMLSTKSPAVLSALRRVLDPRPRHYFQSKRTHSSLSSSSPDAAGESSPPSPPPPPDWPMLDDAFGRSRFHDQHEKAEWMAAAADLAASLGIDPAIATGAQHRRVFHFYLPVFFWLKNLLSGSASSSPPPRDPPCKPLVVGVSAPQGCGKTTLVSEMQRMLEKAGYTCVVVSIDDFYLTGVEQDALAARNPENPLLQVRGNAGTHDMALGLRTIRALTSFDSSSVVRVPKYDKSARGGKGDRAPENQWGVVSMPPDIVLLEGWMLGFEALPDDSPLLSAAEGGESGAASGLGLVNNFLRDYQELHDEVDAWLVLKTADPKMVFEWRAEAERRMREAGRPGMSEDQVRDFCSRYMPAYRAYLPGLYRKFRDACAGAVEPGVGDRELRRYPHEDEDVDDTESESLRGRNLVGLETTRVIEVGRDRNPVT